MVFIAAMLEAVTGRLEGALCAFEPIALYGAIPQRTETEHTNYQYVVPRASKQS